MIYILSYANAPQGAEICTNGVDGNWWNIASRLVRFLALMFVKQYIKWGKNIFLQE